MVLSRVTTAARSDPSTSQQPPVRINLTSPHIPLLDVKSCEMHSALDSADKMLLRNPPTLPIAQDEGPEERRANTGVIAAPQIKSMRWTHPTAPTLLPRLRLGDISSAVLRAQKPSRPRHTL